MSPKISVIVPVYNASRYLQECVQNVRLQSFQDWELLLINDGSSDGSAELCDQLASTDSRIRVFHKPNTGVSDTRNHGVDMASGEYVIFLDADDYWVENSVLKTFLDFAEKYSVDLVRGDYISVTEEGKIISLENFHDSNLANKPIKSIDFVENIIHGEYFTPLTLFRRQTIGTLRFNEKRIFLEDMEFYSRLIVKGCKCAYLPITFYAYRKHSQSISSQINLRKIRDSFTMSEVFAECSNSTEDFELRGYYNYSAAMMYYWTIESLVDGDNFKFYKKNKKTIDLSSAQPKIKTIAHNNYSKPLSPLIFIPPYICVWIMRIKYLLMNFAVKIKRAILSKNI